MNIPLNIDFQQILLHLLNFVLLFAVLYFLLYKPVKNFMDKRTAYYKDMDDRAKQALSEAEKTRTEYEARLSAAEEEILENRRQAEKSLSETTEKRLREASGEAERILSDARSQAQTEREKIVAGAREEITELAAAAAEKILLDSTSDAYDQFLTAAEGRDKNV